MRSKKRSSSGESEQFDEATLEFSRAVKELSFEVLDAGLEPFPELPKTPIRKSRFSLKASAKRAFSKVTGRSNKRKKEGVFQTYTVMDVKTGTRIDVNRVSRVRLFVVIAREAF